MGNNFIHSLILAEILNLFGAHFIPQVVNTGDEQQRSSRLQPSFTRGIGLIIKNFILGLWGFFSVITNTPLIMLSEVFLFCFVVFFTVVSIVL